LCNTQVSWCSVENFTQAIQQNTALIMIETPANPTCSLVDIHAVVNKAKGIPVAVDSTFASPIIQQPLRWGAAYSLHSATKFIGGHSDVLGGVVACSEDLAQQLRKLRIYTGGCLHPLSGYLLHRGLQTLELRVREAQNNATIIAKRLQQHPAVKTVFHPSMTSCDPNGLVGRQMQGPGAMLAINVHGGFTKAAQVMKKVRLITPAVSLGSVDTLIQHPAGLTHRNSAFIQENKSSINDSMLRISIGIEHVEDLWDDLNNALGDGTSDKKEWDQA
jgi:methionine-gamma-lyase